MKITIEFQHLEHTPALDERIKEKSERLNKYLDGNTHIKWHCYTAEQDHHAEVSLFGLGQEFHAKAAEDNLYKSIDKIVDGIDKRENMSTYVGDAQACDSDMPEGIGGGVNATAAPPFASTLEWLAGAKLEECHATLEQLGYGDDLSMVVDGDEEEIAEILAAVEQLAADDQKAKPKVKKFKRELARLRGRGEKFA